MMKARCTWPVHQFRSACSSASIGVAADSSTAGSSLTAPRQVPVPRTKGRQPILPFRSICRRLLRLTLCRWSTMRSCTAAATNSSPLRFRSCAMGSPWRRRRSGRDPVQHRAAPRCDGRRRGRRAIHRPRRVVRAAGRHHRGMEGRGERRGQSRTRVHTHHRRGQLRPRRSTGELDQVRIRAIGCSLMHPLGSSARTTPAACPTPSSTVPTHPPDADHTAGRGESPAYVAPEEYLTAVPEPLPTIAGQPTVRLRIEENVAAVRRAVHSAATAGAWPALERLGDLLAALSEVVTNSLRHGNGERILSVWTDHGAVVCELTDQGEGPVDPLAGYWPPRDHANGGMGLWIVRQLCDAVSIENVDGVTRVRLCRELSLVHGRRPAAGRARPPRRRGRRSQSPAGLAKVRREVRQTASHRRSKPNLDPLS